LGGLSFIVHWRKPSTRAPELFPLAEPGALHGTAAVAFDEIRAPASNVVWARLNVRHGAILILALPPAGDGRRTFQCFDCDRPDPIKTEKNNRLVDGQITAAEAMKRPGRFLRRGPLPLGKSVFSAQHEPGNSLRHRQRLRQGRPKAITPACSTPQLPTMSKRGSGHSSSAPALYSLFAQGGLALEGAQYGPAGIGHGRR
jgi:hypothetical protein